jgi:hypothetical protein
MNEERFPEKVLKMKVKGSCPWDQDGNSRLGKVSHRGMEAHAENLRSNGKTKRGRLGCQMMTHQSPW